MARSKPQKPPKSNPQKLPRAPPPGPRRLRSFAASRFVLKKKNREGAKRRRGKPGGTRSVLSPSRRAGRARGQAPHRLRPRRSGTPEAVWDTMERVPPGALWDTPARPGRCRKTKKPTPRLAPLERCRRYTEPNAEGVSSTSPGLARGTSGYPGSCGQTQQTLQGFHPSGRARRRTEPLQGSSRVGRGPRVGARASRQPWAGGWNAVGVEALPSSHVISAMWYQSPRHPASSASQKRDSKITFAKKKMPFEASVAPFETSVAPIEKMNRAASPIDYAAGQGFGTKFPASFSSPMKHKAILLRKITLCHPFTAAHP